MHANLDCPTYRLIEKRNDREVVPNIVDLGKDGALVVKRMDVTIKNRCSNFEDRSKNQVVLFSVAIDASLDL